MLTKKTRVKMKKSFYANGMQKTQAIALVIQVLVSRVACKCVIITILYPMIYLIYIYIYIYISDIYIYIYIYIYDIASYGLM